MMSAITVDSWNIWIWKTPSVKLDVNGDISATNIAGTLSTAAQPNITSLWLIASLTATNIAWTLTTGSQPNITNLWTLSSLVVNWDTTFDTTTLFVDSTNNRVWIGTITPWVDLDVNDADTAHIRAIITWQTNNPSIYLLADEANNKWWLYSTAPKLELGANNSIHMTVLSTGYVGIGTTSPIAKLHVSWTTSGIARIKHDSNDAQHILGIWNDGNAQYLLYTSAGTNTMKLSAGEASFFNWGNVGIGTTSPNDLLTIEGSMTLKENSSTPSAPTLGYGKIYSKPWIGGVDNYVKLLLHFDSNFDDESDSNHIVTNYADAQIQGWVKKFWDGAVSLDWTGDHLYIPDSDDWYFGSEDFTIDFWLNLSDVSMSACQLISQFKISDGHEFFVLLFTNNYDNYWTIRNGLNFRYRDASSVDIISMDEGSTSWWQNQWVHVALIRNWSSIKLYKNGNEVVSGSHWWTYHNMARILTIWADDWYQTHTNASGFCNGYIDEFRISKWIARWTENFTPPVAQYGGWLYYKNSSWNETPLIWEWSAGWSSSIWWQSSSDIYYNNGNVGLGTSTPAVALDIAGDVNISGILKKKSLHGRYIFNTDTPGTISNGRVMDMWTEAEDPNNIYTLTSNSYITPNIPGYYQINARFHLIGGTNGWGFEIHRNAGTDEQLGTAWDLNWTNHVSHGFISYPIYLDWVDDYVFIKHLPYGASFYTASRSSWLSIEYLGN